MILSWGSFLGIFHCRADIKFSEQQMSERYGDDI